MECVDLGKVHRRGSKKVHLKQKSKVHEDKSNDRGAPQSGAHPHCHALAFVAKTVSPAQGDPD